MDRSAHRFSKIPPAPLFSPGPSTTTFPERIQRPLTNAYVRFSRMKICIARSWYPGPQPRGNFIGTKDENARPVAIHVFPIDSIVSKYNVSGIKFYSLISTGNRSNVARFSLVDRDFYPSLFCARCPGNARYKFLCPRSLNVYVVGPRSKWKVISRNAVGPDQKIPIDSTTT